MAGGSKDESRTSHTGLFYPGWMAGGSKDERRTSFTAPFYKTSNIVVAQPKTANIADPSPFQFKWTIDRFSRINAKRLYSDVFEVGGYKWRVLIFPKGKNVMDYLHMYLCAADSASLPDGWSRYAQFSLTVVNQITDKYSLTKVTQHQFNKLQRGWGDASFIPLAELFDPSRGYLVNDTLVVEVEVICNVDDKDTAEHIRERLKKDWEVKEHKNKENPEAHLYTFIKLVRDEDLAEQIGKDIYFDLLDHDNMIFFRVQKQTSFNVFKHSAQAGDRVSIIPSFQYLGTTLWEVILKFLYPNTRVMEVGKVKFVNC